VSTTRILPLEPARRRSRPATTSRNHQRRLRRLLDLPPPARTPTHPHQPLPAPIRSGRLTNIKKVTQRETHPLPSSVNATVWRVPAATAVTVLTASEADTVACPSLSLPQAATACPPAPEGDTPTGAAHAGTPTTDYTSAPVAPSTATARTIHDRNHHRPTSGPDKTTAVRRAKA
jgi:hypothetical protein